MKDDIREELADVIACISGHKKPIEDSFCLYHDLGIAGDDACELLEKVHNKFGTKFDEFEFIKYFPSETTFVFYYLRKIFGFQDKLKRFTVGHLVEVVKAGHFVA